MQYNGIYWQPPTTISTNYAQYPTALSSIPGNPVIYYVWTEGHKIPYKIKTNRSSLNKSSSENLVPSYSRSISWLNGSENYLQLKVENFILKYDDESQKILSFINLPSDSISLTTQSACSYLTSQPFILNTALDSILIDYSLITENMDKVLTNSVDELKISMDIINDKDRSIVNNLSLIPVTGKKMVNNKHNAISFSILKDGYTNNSLKINIRIKDLKTLNDTYVSLGHIYDFTDSKSEIKSQYKKPILADKSKTVLSLSNYPNPFNPSSTISYSIPENTNVSLTIFDMQGRVVKNLVHGYKKSGKHSVIWDGKNEIGSTVSSGLYIYVLRTANKAISKKMLMIH